MKQVYDNLYVGDVNDADNPKQHDKKNIEYIINVSGSGPERDSAPGYETVKNKDYIHIPLADGPSNSDFMLTETIRLAHKVYRQAVEEDVSVLIHCAVGSSRSVSIAAAVMSLENQKVVRENVERIKKVRPIANPEDGLLNKVSKITSDVYTEEQG